MTVGDMDMTGRCSGDITSGWITVMAIGITIAMGIGIAIGIAIGMEGVIEGQLRPPRGV